MKNDRKHTFGVNDYIRVKLWNERFMKRYLEMAASIEKDDPKKVKHEHTYNAQG